MPRLLSVAVLLSGVFALCLADPKVCSILSYGAKCDNSSDDSPFIQLALDDLSCTSVLVPAPHMCVSRCLNLSSMSSRALLIESGAQLIVWRTPETYSLTHANNMFLSATSGDGSWTGPLLSDFTLSGGGAIVGGGAAWWPKAGSNRPRILWIPNGQNISVSNLTFTDSPAWNMGLRGNTIRVENMRLVAGGDSCGGFGHAPNTDGCNIGGHDIQVRNVFVHNGDDCVPLTTGNDGSTSNVLVENVHCECGTNGFVIYNQGGTVSGVVAQNLTVVNTNQGAGVKLSRPGKDASGGLVENITWRDVHIQHPRYAALYVNVFQEDAQPPCTLPKDPALPNWLTVQGLTFQNVSATVAQGQAAGCFRCTPGKPCSATFDGVQVVEDGGKTAAPFVCLNFHGKEDGGGSVPHACT